MIQKNKYQKRNWDLKRAKIFSMAPSNLIFNGNILIILILLAQCRISDNCQHSGHRQQSNNLRLSRITSQCRLRHSIHIHCNHLFIITRWLWHTPSALILFRWLLRWFWCHICSRWLRCNISRFVLGWSVCWFRCLHWSRSFDWFSCSWTWCFDWLSLGWSRSLFCLLRCWSRSFHWFSRRWSRSLDWFCLGWSRCFQLCWPRRLHRLAFGWSRCFDWFSLRWTRSLDWFGWLIGWFWFTPSRLILGWLLGWFWCQISGTGWTSRWLICSSRSWIDGDWSSWFLRWLSRCVRRRIERHSACWFRRWRGCWTFCDTSINSNASHSLILACASYCCSSLSTTFHKIIFASTMECAMLPVCSQSNVVTWAIIMTHSWSLCWFRRC